MNKLSIFWCEKTQKSFYWVVCDNNHETLSSPIHLLDSKEILKDDLACLADIAVGKKVELILSNTDVLISQVSLPNRAQRHVRKAVPYLLEEQLAEAVDKTFVAIGERLSNGNIPVRAIKQNYLIDLLEKFSNAEIKLDKMRVDLDLLETPSVGFVLLAIGEQFLICEESGFRWSCYRDDFFWLVQKRLSEIKFENDIPIAIPLKLIGENEDSYRLFESELPVGVFAPQLELVESVTQYLAKSKEPLINILQGEYETKEENSPVKVMLYKVATIVGMLLFVHILFQTSMIFSLNQQKDLLGKEREVLWEQAFPGRKIPGNMDSVLRSTLASLNTGDGEASFLMMLDSTTSQIKDIQKIYPTNISYDASRNELRMDLVALDLPILNQYRDDLKQSGHEVDMSSATQRGDGYSSRLIIRK